MVQGRNKGDKKLVVIAVEKVKGNKIGRAYAEVIEQASGDCFKPFFERYIDKDNAQVITDRWRGYQPLESEFEIRQKSSNGGKAFPGLHCVIMNLKGWIRGIHHSVSDDHFQNYLDEFHYRFNRRNSTNTIFNNLINRIVRHNPFTFKDIKGIVT